MSISPSDVFNFQCFLKRSTTPETLFTANLSIQIIAPIIYGGFAFVTKYLIDLLLRICWDVKMKCNWKTVRINLIISFFLAYRNWYARTIISTLELLKCVYLGDPQHDYLRANPDIACWDTKHNKILYGTIFPGIIVWALILPCFTFYFLKTHSHLS